MIAVDTNILVYAHYEKLPQHQSARERLVSLAERPEPWAIPVFCLAEFARVVTHPRLFSPPFSAEEACVAVERLLESPSLRVLYPGPRFPSLFLQAIRESAATGNLIFDAQIVALCQEAGAHALLTEDRDFMRFPRFVVEQL